MTTMANAIRRFVETKQAGATSRDIRNHINNAYPDQWRPGTLNAHLYACVVNNPKSYIHHKSADRFLFKDGNDRFYLYDEETHGPNIWEPVPTETGDAEELGSNETIEQLVETSISFERDVEEHLIRNLSSVEEGLVFVDRQVSIDVGRVDILAEDVNGQRVVIELKVGEAKDAAVGQIARYLGWYARQDGKPPRGMLIASEFPEAVRYAAEAVKGLSLVQYRVQFAFNAIAIDE